MAPEVAMDVINMNAVRVVASVVAGVGTAVLLARPPFGKGDMV